MTLLSPSLFFSKYTKNSSLIQLIYASVLISLVLYLFHPDILLTYWQQSDFVQLIKISDVSTLIFSLIFHVSNFFNPVESISNFFNHSFYLYFIYILILLKSIAVIYALYYFLKISYHLSNDSHSNYSNHKKIALIFLFYTIIFSICFHWLHIATHEHGKLFWPMSIFALLAFGAYNALYYTIAAFITLKVRLNFVGFAFLTASVEYLKAKILTGFPWALGVQSTIGLQAFEGLHVLFAYFGEYMVNVIFWLIISLLYYLPKKLKISKLFKICILISVLHIYGVYHILNSNLSKINLNLKNSHEIMQPNSKILNLRLVQGNIDQKKKFDSSFAQQTENTYQQLITQKSLILDPIQKYNSSNLNLDLIVTPETALPMLAQDIDSNWFKEITNTPHLKNTQIIIGALDLERNLATQVDWQFVNRLFNFSYNQLNPISQTTETMETMPPYLFLEKIYAKHHLVPFGEFVPWGFQWYVDLMNLPLGRLYRASSLQMPFELISKNMRLQFNICYELIFSDEVARQNRLMPSDILINNTNLAWFGHTSVFWQFLKMAQIRAYELQIPVAIVANNGPTVLINQNGYILKALPTDKSGVLDISLELISKNQGNLSFYVRYQNMIEIILQLMIALFLAFITLNHILKKSSANN